MSMYPRTTWTCGICGKSNPGDLGECPRCRGGSVSPHGGLDAGAIPYFPVAHVRMAGFEVTDAHLPGRERGAKYPHHLSSIRA